MAWPEDAAQRNPAGVTVAQDGSVVLEPAVELDFQGAGVAVTREGQRAVVTIGGGGGGSVVSVVGGPGIAVDATDPANPIVSALVREAIVVFDDAAIKQWPVVGLNQLIAAPGAGKLLFPLSMTFVTSFAGGAYTNINASCGVTPYVGVPANGLDLFGYQAQGNTNAQTRPGAWLGSTTAKLVPWIHVPRLGGTNFPYTYDLVGSENQPLNLNVGNGAAGAFTGGNAANFITINIRYMVIDV